MKTKTDKSKNGDSDSESRPEKHTSALASGPPPPAPIVSKSADVPRPPGWNGQLRRHGSSRFNVHSHNQELVKLPPLKVHGSRDGLWRWLLRRRELCLNYNDVFSPRRVSASTSLVSVELGWHIENIGKARFFVAAAATPPRLSCSERSASDSR
ncbi:unnamed protein product [Plutella xylostella]|uniref:(diamondback moth) hypothetical protein n=1 Tax=Plutella xylostella TaxID=51655 RepID=A0A8S4DT40_PLUXY|nr:unnamed protein product [Plutella xylostella]